MDKGKLPEAIVKKLTVLKQYTLNLNLFLLDSVVYMSIFHSVLGLDIILIPLIFGNAT